MEERPDIRAASDPPDRGHTDGRRSSTVTIAITDVKLPNQPIRPVDEHHVAVLAEVIDDLPPISVHRATNTLIDGLHRLTVFRRAKRERIPVEYFDGTEEDAVIEAIRANTAHGRPLTLQERRRAARWLLEQNPARSDRAIGRVCSLDHKTVGALRNNAAATTANGSRARRPTSGVLALSIEAAKRRPHAVTKAELAQLQPDALRGLLDDVRWHAQRWHKLADMIEDLEHH
jgi:hypothetical protein